MKKVIKISTVFLLLVFFSGTVFSQSIVGFWKTIDDETNEAKSVVEIYKGSNNKYYGKVDKLFRKEGEDPNPMCDECPGYKQGKPILGMIIITNMEKNGNKYSGGKILDPSNGKEYKCKMWIEDGKLQVRGYVGFNALGRSQTWHKYKK